MVGKLGCGCCRENPGNDDPPNYNGCNCPEYHQRNNYTWDHDISGGLPSSHFFFNQNPVTTADITRWYRQGRSYHFPTDGFGPYDSTSGWQGWAPTGDWNSLFSLRENSFANQIALNERDYEYKIEVTTPSEYAPFYLWTSSNPLLPERNEYFGMGESKLRFQDAATGLQQVITHGVAVKLRMPAMFFAGEYPVLGTPKLYYTIWKPGFASGLNVTPFYEQEIPWGTHELAMKIKSAPFAYPDTPQVFIELKLNGSTVYQEEVSSMASRGFRWVKCTATPDYWRYLNCAYFDYGNLYVAKRLPLSGGTHFVWRTNPQDTRYWDDLVFDPQFKT